MRYRTGRHENELRQSSDCAQVILQLATKDQLPAHLLLGSDAVQYSRLAENKQEFDANAWPDISITTDSDDVQREHVLKL